MSFNYITKDGVTFILSCVLTMSLANFDYHILSSPTTHPHHPTSYYYKVYGSSCLQCVLGVVKMICNLIWPWVLLFVFVLGRNKNVKFSLCKLWKDFYLKGDMWNFLHIFWRFSFLFFSFLMNTMFRKKKCSYTYSSWVWEASRLK